MKWLLARLREPSTWRGLVWLLTALGVTLSPEAWEYMTAIGMAAAGLLGVLTSEAPKRVEIQLPPVEVVRARPEPATTHRPAEPGRNRRPGGAVDLSVLRATGQLRESVAVPSPPPAGWGDRD